MSNLEALVQSAAAQGAAQVIETLGLSSGEICQGKAREIYGSWFMEAVKKGKIRPCRIGKGPKGARHYRIVEILQQRTADIMLAELQTREVRKP